MLFLLHLQMHSSVVSPFLTIFPFLLLLLPLSYHPLSTLPSLSHPSFHVRVNLMCCCSCCCCCCSSCCSLTLVLPPTVSLPLPPLYLPPPLLPFSACHKHFVDTLRELYKKMFTLSTHVSPSHSPPSYFVYVSLSPSPPLTPCTFLVCRIFLHFFYDAFLLKI